MAANNETLAQSDRPSAGMVDWRDFTLGTPGQTIAGFGTLKPTLGTRRALISLTPLIDVVFILLVFFMLASSFLDWRSIELDTPGSNRAGTPLEGALLVEVRPDGLRLSGVMMSQQDLNRRLAELTAANHERRVLVKPVAGVAMQNLVAVLDSLATAGIKDLSLITDSRR